MVDPNNCSIPERIILLSCFASYPTLAPELKVALVPGIVDLTSTLTSFLDMVGYFPGVVEDYGSGVH